MGKSLRVLHVEDSERDVVLLDRHLRAAGYDLVSERVETAKSMKTALETGSWEIVFCDYTMPNFDAMAALDILHASAVDIPFIIISGAVGEDVAVRSMLNGAHDYIPKGNLTRLMPAIQRELTQAEYRRAKSKAEEALKASEAELRALFAAMTDVIFVLGADGYFRRIAPTDPTFLYKPAQDLIGKNLQEVFTTEQADFFLKHIRKALNKGQMHSVEYSLQIDGVEIWFDGSVSPMSDDSVLWIGRDITHRKRAEDDLRESEERFAGAFEQAPIGVALVLPDGRWLKVNRALCDLLGYSEAELLDLTFQDITHSDDLERNLQNMDLLLSRKISHYQMEKRYIHKQGHPVFVLLHVSLVRHESGDPRYFIVQIEDITDRKADEHQLRLHSLILNSIGQAVIVTDSAGTITYWNKLAEKMYGWTSSEVMGRNIIEVTPTDATRAEGVEILETLMRGESWSGEYTVQDRHGNAFPIFVTNTPLVDAEGRVESIIGISLDVTERKQAEERLRENESLLSSTQTIAHIGSWVMDLSDSGTMETARESWSDEHYRIFGFEPGEVEITNELFFNSVHPDDRERVAAALQKAIEQGHPFEIEHRIILPDGGERFVHAMSEMIVDDKTGKPQKLRGSVQDITDRKCAEEALRESESRLRTIIDTEPECVKLLASDGSFLEMNPAGLRMIEADSFDEIAERSVYDLVAKQDHRAFCDLITKVFNGESGMLEFQVIGLKGTHRWMDTHASPLLDASGQITALLGITRDITERKRTEGEIDLALERLNRAQRIGKIGDWDRDLKSGSVTWSYEVYEIVGRDPHLGPPDYDEQLQYYDIPSRQVLEEKVAAAIESGEKQDYELVVVRSDGEHVSVQATCEPRKDSGGTIVALNGTIQDISDRKLAERALRASESRYHSLFENMLEGYAYCETIFDGDRLIDFIYIEVNGAFETMTGLQNVAGKKVSDAIPGLAKSNPKIFETYGRVALTGIPEKFETYIEPLGIWLCVTTYSSSRENFVAMFDDITARKRAESALRESDEKFHQLADNITDAFWIRSPDMQTIHYRSPAYEKIWGRALEGDYAKPHEWYDYILPVDRQRVKEAYAALMHDSPNIDIEYRIVRPDGERRWVRARGFQVRDAEGRLIRLAGIATDITERKLAIEALAESEERNRELVENAIDVIYTHDLEGNYTFLNRAGERITGYTSEEALTMNIADTIAPEYLAKAQQMIAEMLAGNDIAANDFELMAKNNQRIAFEVNTRIIYENGVAVGVQGIARDITERKNAEALLIESKEQLTLATEAANIGIWDWDLVEDTMKWDARMYELYGNYDEDFSGASDSWNFNYHPDDVERVFAESVAAIEGPEDFHSEFRIVWPDGEVRHLESSAKVQRDENGMALHFVGVNWDITERKLAEETLREADQRAIREYGLLLTRVAKLALALGDARDLDSVFAELREFAFVSTGMDGFIISLFDAERKTRTAAYVWSDGVKVDAPSLPPMEMSDSPHSRSVLTGEIIITDDFQSVMEGQPVVHLGGDHPQSSLVVPMSVMGKIVGGVEVQSNHLAAFTDSHATALQMAANLAANAIDNVRLMEKDRDQAEQLRQAQKMEAVGVLAGGIAHDFNNLLTAINGYSDLTLRKMAADDPLKRNIEEVKKAGDRAAELTGQLLAFSRKKVLKPIVHNLNSVIETIEKMLCRIIRENIELRTVLDPDLGNILADPGQIEQVIMNLAVNARDAMPDGGTLTIETRNVFLDDEYISHKLAIEPGPFARMTISDTGIGMDASTQQHIFEPFFTTKEVGKGTGLGLAMVYGIVKQSGGDILVYSEPGHGTTFKIYLPHVDKTVEKPKWIGDRIGKYLGTETILLVEDEEVVRNLVREILTDNGYKVLEAASGKVALSICEDYSEPIHMLLTDVIMPKMGGAELKKRVVELLPEIKVLYISGYTDDSIAQRGVFDSDTDFIEKPFTPDGLARKVREVFEY